jgi:cytochrome c oxidase subunit 3
MIVFVLTEVMFFAGLISAFTIAEAGSRMPWPPANQPRLPVEETAFNTCMLIASGITLVIASRIYRKDAKRARTWVLAAFGLGAFFVAFQGIEWVALIREGLTITTSTHGSFFYLLVGTHALHAVAALAGMLYVYGHMLRGTAKISMLWTVEVFWLFVVGVWPVLYGLVYL